MADTTFKSALLSHGNNQSPDKTMDVTNHYGSDLNVSMNQYH